MGSESATGIAEQAPKQEKELTFEELYELMSKMSPGENHKPTPSYSRLVSARVEIAKLKEGMGHINEMKIEPAIRILNKFPKIVVLTKPIRGRRLKTPIPVTSERDSRAIIAGSYKEIIIDNEKKILFSGFFAELPNIDELCNLRSGEEFSNYTAYLQTDMSEETVRGKIKKVLGKSYINDAKNWHIDPYEFRHHQEFPLVVPHQPVKATA